MLKLSEDEARGLDGIYKGFQTPKESQGQAERELGMPQKVLLIPTTCCGTFGDRGDHLGRYAPYTAACR